LKHSYCCTGRSSCCDNRIKKIDNTDSLIEVSRKLAVVFCRREVMSITEKAEMEGLRFWEELEHGCKNTISKRISKFCETLVSGAIFALRWTKQQ